MPTPITNTTVNFTYNIPDEIHSTANTLNRTADAVYEGPDRVWVFVDADTGKIVPGVSDLTTRDDGADVPVPPGQAKIEIVAADDPLVISLVRAGYCTTKDQTMITDNLPDGTTRIYNSKAEVAQCYNRDDLTYDFDTNSWKDLEFMDSPITWDDVIAARTGLLVASDAKIAPDMPESVKAPWIEYRQKLRDLPATYGRGTDDEWPAWKVNMPTEPTS